MKRIWNCFHFSIMSKNFIQTIIFKKNEIDVRQIEIIVSTFEFSIVNILIYQIYLNVRIDVSIKKIYFDK